MPLLLRCTLSRRKCVGNAGQGSRNVMPSSRFDLSSRKVFTLLIASLVRQSNRLLGMRQSVICDLGEWRLTSLIRASYSLITRAGGCVSASLPPACKKKLLWFVVLWYDMSYALTYARKLSTFVGKNGAIYTTPGKMLPYRFYK